MLWCDQMTISGRAWHKRRHSFNAKSGLSLYKNSAAGIRLTLNSVPGRKYKASSNFKRYPFVRSPQVGTVSITVKTSDTRLSEANHVRLAFAPLPPKAVLTPFINAIFITLSSREFSLRWSTYLGLSPDAGLHSQSGGGPLLLTGER